MNAEDLIRNIKEQPPVSPTQRKQNIKISIILAVSTLVSISLLGYTFIQKQEVDQQRKRAEKLKAIAEEQRMEVLKAMEMAVTAQQEAERQHKLAAQALEECKNAKH
jgi:hypothetical protein